MVGFSREWHRILDYQGFGEVGAIFYFYIRYDLPSSFGDFTRKWRELKGKIQ